MFKNTLKSSEINRSRFLKYNKIYYYQIYKYDKLKFRLIRFKKRIKRKLDFVLNVFTLQLQNTCAIALHRRENPFLSVCA